MKKILMVRGAFLLAFGGLFVGCSGGGTSATSMSSDGRGTFGGESCESGERVPVDATAAYAIYLDSEGNLLSTAQAEDLSGTEGNMMCPTPTKTGSPSDPAGCPQGYCARTVAGKAYCLKC